MISIIEVLTEVRSRNAMVPTIRDFWGDEWWNSISMHILLSNSNAPKPSPIRSQVSLEMNITFQTRKQENASSRIRWGQTCSPQTQFDEELTFHWEGPFRSWPYTTASNSFRVAELGQMWNKGSCHFLSWVFTHIAGDEFCLNDSKRNPAITVSSSGWELDSVIPQGL